MIKAGVVGALGKMGKEVSNMVILDPDMELALQVDINSNDTKIEKDLENALNKTQVDVVVDFTQPNSVYQNAKMYIEKGIKAVIGTTGLKPNEIEELKKLSENNNTGIVIAPNFSIGAVLMMMFSKTASKYFDNAEIIEFHHNQKKDAPSGTAIKTAELMNTEKENFMLNNSSETELIEGARGANHKGNIKIHSVRMPGFVASQEVILGSSGQTLKIRHDSIDRACYMSGVNLAMKHVIKNNKFIYGLENIL